MNVFLKRKRHRQIHAAATFCLMLLVMSLSLSACGVSAERKASSSTGILSNTEEDAPVNAEEDNSVESPEEAAAEDNSADIQEEAAAEDAYSMYTDGLKEDGEQLIGPFQTADLEGNEVTESVFAQADVTFVNVWGTFCPPCIGEMPELEEIHKDLPEHFQMIGILCDVPGENSIQYPTALEIVERTGVTYPSLLGSESMEDFLGTIAAVPTSFFVDSNGCVIGDPIIGADTNAYKKRIEELKAIYGSEN